jgi:hypothetical protein
MDVPLVVLNKVEDLDVWTHNMDMPSRTYIGFAI